MSRLLIWPYKMGSASARDLAESLDCLRIHSNRNYVPRGTDLVINYGNSFDPTWYGEARRKGTFIFNLPAAVSNAVNKANSFDLLRQYNVRVPDYTRNRADALEWSIARNRILLRQTLTGHGGDGIVVVPPGERNFGTAPLYVKYVKKRSEYRLHIFGDSIIAASEKRRRNGGVENDYIRSHNNGWVYCRIEPGDLPEAITEEAFKAIRALELSFGAVDLIVGRNDRLPYVLEVNTAPGIEGQTLEAYVEAIQLLWEGL